MSDMEAMPIVRGSDVFATMGAAFEPHSKLTIVQKVSILEGVSQGICEIPNTYEIYGGDEEGTPLFVASENSGACDRCCCAPGHSFILEIAPHGRPNNVVMSLEREGCTFPLCCTAPKPLLCCCACTKSCTDSIQIHEGKVEGAAGKIEAPKVVGMVRQPSKGGGGCTPTLELYSSASKEPVAYVEGPCIFGGCTELCCDADFPISREKGKAGDLGKIKHKKPQDCGDFFAELCTDSDRFIVEFEHGITVEEKGQALAATMLTDFMFFERDNGMLRCRGGNTCEVTCCVCFCFGCVCPVSFSCSNSGNNEGEEGEHSE